MKTPPKKCFGYTLQQHLQITIFCGYLGWVFVEAGHTVGSWRFWVFGAPTSYLIGQGLKRVWEGRS
jgi:hypothetical protein